MPSQINLATMANSKCVDTCTWTRTVKATKNGSWTATTQNGIWVEETDEIIDGPALTVSPESFTPRSRTNARNYNYCRCN